MSASQFYHKETGKRPNRRESVMLINGGGKKDQPPNPDREADHYLRKNIKLFVILIVVMVSLLVLGIKYVEYQWGRRDKRNMSQFTHDDAISAPAVLSSNRPSPRTVTVLPSPLPATDAVSPVRQDEVETILRWGKILEEAGEPEGAVDRYGEALKIDPENIEVLTRIGRLEIRMSRYSEAVEALTLAHELAGGDPDIMNDLGVALTFDGQATEAVELYKGLLESNPDYTPALFNYGYAHLQLQQHDEAYPLIDRYLLSKPDDSMALGIMAILELKLDRPDAALERLDKAIAVSPDWVTPYLDAATVCASIEDNERALAYLNRALAISEPSVVYKRYKTSAFDRLRITDQGKDFEKTIAARAREELAVP